MTATYVHGALDCPVDLGESFELISVGDAKGTKFTNHVGRNSYGDHLPATNQQRNQRQDITCTFRSILPAGATATINLGGSTGYSGYIATRVVVRQMNEEDATVEISLHKHAGNANLHLAGTVAVALPSCGWGVLAAPLTGELLTNNIRMEWSATMDHLDRTDRVGDHLVGVSFGCQLQCTQEYIDDRAAIEAADDWYIDSDVPSEENTNVRTRTVVGHSFLGVTRT